MADFGSLFDNAKGEADKEREEKAARLKAAQEEKKAKLDAGMRPILEIVDPVFASAAAQLKTKDVKLSRDVNSKLLYENGEREPARNYQFRLGFHQPGRTYHFQMVTADTILCTSYSYDHQFSPHHSGRQVLRCNVAELTAEKVEDIVRQAIDEVARSK